jgi:hypothetical protein
MEQTECSETSAYKLQTPGNYPKESIQQVEHGESLKSRIVLIYFTHHYMFTFQRLHLWPQQHPFPYLYNSPNNGNENNYFIHYTLYIGVVDLQKRYSIASARKVTEYVSSHVIRVPLRDLSLPITLRCDGLRLGRWRLGDGLSPEATFADGVGDEGFHLFQRLCGGIP